MPSGSHGGGHGGSHGGSSGGGGSHWGGGSSRGGSFRRRPMYVYWGHTRYVVGSRASAFISLLLVLLVFAFFGIFTTSMLRTGATSQIRLIEQDYIYYHNMIDNAKVNPDDLIVDGVVKSKFYNTTVKKWYVTYKFLDDNGVWVDGYTFALYSNEEAMEFKTNDTIKLAVDGVPITQETDSIPLDYEYMPLEKDGYYVVYKNQHRGAKIAQGVCIGIAAGIIVLSVVIAYTNKKKVEDSSNSNAKPQQTASNPKFEKEANNERVERDFTENVTYCQYCGATMKKGKLKCPECGAKQDR